MASPTFQPDPNSGLNLTGQRLVHTMNATDTGNGIGAGVTLRVYQGDDATYRETVQCIKPAEGDQLAVFTYLTDNTGQAVDGTKWSSTAIQHALS